jgi:plastocyanin
MSSVFPRGLLVAGVAAVAACGAQEQPVVEQVAPAQPNVVDVTATDYAFAMPDTLPAGVTTFRLVNQGSELHHVVLTRIPDGMTVADFAKLPEGPPPAGAVLAGGPNPAAPGGTVEATLDLAPGQYTVICVIPSPDGKPHVAKGMMRGLVVTAGNSTAALPAPDVTMTLSDYDFQLSTPLTAGKRVIRIENTAEQPHELVFIKLNAGKTAQDVADWAMKMEGPPPGTPVPGASPMSKGISNTVVVDVTPGDYALICFVPDAKDGRPHLAHGMLKQITVN